MIQVIVTVVLSWAHVAGTSPACGAPAVAARIAPHPLAGTAPRVSRTASRHRNCRGGQGRRAASTRSSPCRMRRPGRRCAIWGWSIPCPRCTRGWPTGSRWTSSVAWYGAEPQPPSSQGGRSGVPRAPRSPGTRAFDHERSAGSHPEACGRGSRQSSASAASPSPSHTSLRSSSSSSCRSKPAPSRALARH